MALAGHYFFFWFNDIQMIVTVGPRSQVWDKTMSKSSGIDYVIISISPRDSYFVVHDSMLEQSFCVVTH